jgi:catalase
MLTFCRAHSKTIGGIPVASDVFLFQKQQTFNRSKNLERMVHPCGSGAFGYFECKMSKFTLNVKHANFAQALRRSTLSRYARRLMSVRRWGLTFR